MSGEPAEPAVVADDRAGASTAATAAGHRDGSVGQPDHLNADQLDLAGGSTTGATAARAHVGAVPVAAAPAVGGESGRGASAAGTVGRTRVLAGGADPDAQLLP